MDLKEFRRLKSQTESDNKLILRVLQREELHSSARRYLGEPILQPTRRPALQQTKKGRNSKRQLRSKMLRGKKVSFGFFTPFIFLFIMILVNFSLVAFNYRSLKNKKGRIKNYTTFVLDSVDNWILLYGINVYLTNAIFWDNTYKTSNNKTNIDSYIDMDLQMRARMIPQLETYSKKDFGPFTKFYRNLYFEGNLCEILMSNSMIDCGYVYHGFMQEGVISFYKGYLSLMRQLYQEYELAKGNEKKLKDLINSRKVINNFAYARYVFGTIYLQTTANVQAKTRLELKEYLLQVKATISTEQLFNLVLMTIAVIYLQRKVNQIHVQFYTVLKLVPISYLEKNMLVRKYLKKLYEKRN